MSSVVDRRATLLHACEEASASGIVGLRGHVQLGEHLQAVGERGDALELCNGCRQLLCFQAGDVPAVPSGELRGRSRSSLGITIEPRIVDPVVEGREVPVGGPGRLRLH